MEVVTERILEREIQDVCGGVLTVSTEDECRKGAGSFELLEYKRDLWNKCGQPCKCRFCWHLKYSDDYFCDKN